MNSEVKEAWLVALRSGEYTQTKCALKKEDAFCCLGVLCDLYAKENGLEWRKYKHASNLFEFEGETQVLSLNVRDWAGLESSNPNIILPKGGLTSLASLNDSGSSFTEIADIIEKSEL